jgi:hypothetical protein
MKTTQSFEPLKRIIRSEICAGCSRRPKDQGVEDSSKPLSCEHDCGIFIHLPQLARLAATRDSMLLKSAAVATTTEPEAETVGKHQTPLDCYGARTVDVLAHAGVFCG